MATENEVKPTQITKPAPGLVYNVNIVPDTASIPAPTPAQSGTKSEMEEMAELLLRAQKLRMLQDAMNPQPAAAAPVVVQQQTTIQQPTMAPGPAAGYEPKSRVAYVLLALFFGFLGVHNFYAKRIGVGIAQLLISVFLGAATMGAVFVFLFIWVVIEMIAVTTDGSGVRMR